MNILFVAKKQHVSNWSSAITLLAEGLKSKGHVDVYYINSEKKIHIHEYDLFLINHSICFYMMFIKYGYKFISKAVFLPHEGEPLLGWRFLINNWHGISCGRLLRYSKLYNKIPNILCHDTVLLSSVQNKFYNKSTVIPFLGCDENLFQPSKDIIKKNDILFPSKVESPEKNYKAIRYLSSAYTITHPHNTPNTNMPYLYNSAKVILIPSVLETYGLVVIEAMLTNSVIIASNNIGVVCELNNEYGFERLRKHGLFILDDFSQGNISLLVENALSFSSKEMCTTRKLALDFGLTSSRSMEKLLRYVNGKDI